MTDDFKQRQQTIYQEMMSHPALFTHRHPQKIAIIGEDNLLKPELAEGSKVIKRTRVLDVMIPSTLSNARAGYPRIVSCLWKTFFPRVAQPSERACEQFMDDDSHFNIRPAVYVQK